MQVNIFIFLLSQYSDRACFVTYVRYYCRRGASPFLRLTPAGVTKHFVKRQSAGVTRPPAPVSHPPAQVTRAMVAVILQPQVMHRLCTSHPAHRKHHKAGLFPLKWKKSSLIRFCRQFRHLVNGAAAGARYSGCPGRSCPELPIRWPVDIGFGGQKLLGSA